MKRSPVSRGNERSPAGLEQAHHRQREERPVEQDHPHRHSGRGHSVEQPGQDFGHRLLGDRGQPDGVPTRRPTMHAVAYVWNVWVPDDALARVVLRSGAP